MKLRRAHVRVTTASSNNLSVEENLKLSLSFSYSTNSNTFLFHSFISIKGLEKSLNIDKPVFDKILAICNQCFYIQKIR